MKHLHALLADGLRFNPHYLPSGNSDHLPMTLCAMSGLGAEAGLLDEYRADYSQILHDISAAPPIDHWRTGLGEGDEAYPAVLSWCLAEIDATSVATTVAKLLPELIDSLALRALHPLIRLGYALEFADPNEVAAALAYWITSHRDVPLSLAKPIDLQAVLHDQVAAQKRREYPTFESSIFGLRLHEQIDADRYPQGRADSLQTCAQLALDLYRSTRNFFALHLVTASQALRQCQPYLDEDQGLAALTGAMLAAHRALDCPDFDQSNPLPAPDTIDREHGYKYAWACLSEYRHYQEPRYAEELRGFRDAGLVPAWCGAAEL